MQCDFDTIGTRSIAADIETALVIHDLFRAIGFREFTIRVNNRMVLTGLLERLGLADRATAVLRALDKLGKIGPEQRGRGDGRRRRHHRRAGPARSCGWPRSPAPTTTCCGSSSRWWPAARPARRAWPSSARSWPALAAAGVPAERVQLDVSIARGLDYYTGTVFETFLDALPGIGSVCSGGRYDNLAGLYTNQELPGIGASLGLDRLLAAMEELGMIEKVATPAPVFIPYFDKDRLHDYLRLAAALRAAGIGVEVFPEPKKLGQQLKYADRRGFRVALIAGAERVRRRASARSRTLQRAAQQDVPLEPDAASVIAAVKEILGGEG